MIEQRAVTLGDRFQLRNQVRELVHVPPANIAQDTLPFDSVGAWRLSIGVRVIVMPRRRVAEPRESRQPLALGQHVRSYPCLMRRQRLHQQIALQLGDARPVLHVALEIRRIDTAVLGGQTGNRALHVADAGQVLVQTGLIVVRQLLLQRRHVLAHRIEDAALAIHPAFLALAEQAVEEAVGDHLRRERALEAGPAHIALHTLAKRFLRDADLQRTEARVAAELGRDHLVDRRSCRAASGEAGSGHQAAHRVGVAVTLSVGRRVVETAQHVNIGPERREGRKARRDAEVRALFGGDPVSLGDAVAVEPEHEAALDRLIGAAGGSGGRRIGGPVRIHHRHQRRQPDDNARAGRGDSLQ